MCIEKYSTLSAGKEYVCVLRLHDSIASEAKLAQVSWAGFVGGEIEVPVMTAGLMVM